METIASRQNPLVSLMRRVAQGDPEQKGRILLDGLHLLQEARAAGVAVSSAAFGTRALAAADGQARRLATTLAGLGCRVVQVSDQVLEAMSPTESPSGVVALGTRPRHELSSVLPPAVPRPFLCVAVDVQDPGNIGAIARVAEAGGAHGVIACGASADPFGWKALRGAMGSAFRLPMVREPDTAGVLAALTQAGVRLLAAAPGGRGSFYDLPWDPPCAVLLGSEGHGLSPDIVAASDAVITIPMQPPVESLNVAVSAALIVYEARRRRLAGGSAP